MNHATNPPASDKMMNIQALRAVAALLVLWVHLRFPIFDIDRQTHLPPCLDITVGAVGVDIFFAISGFIICYTATRKYGQSALDFLIARIARIAPLYLIMSAPHIIKHVLTHENRALRGIWNNTLFLPLFDWKDFSPPLHPYGWTLSYEMWFYVVFAVMLCRWKPARAAVMLPVFFLAGALLTLPYHAAWFFPKFAFNPMCLEFGLGCLIFHFRNKIRGRACPLALIAIGLALLIGVAPRYHLVGAIGLPYLWLRFFAWGIPSALLVAGFITLEANTGWTLPRPLAWLGEISYSLYLVQPLAGKIAVYLCLLLGYHHLGSISLMVFAVAIPIAWISWLLIERPLTPLVRRWLMKLVGHRPPMHSIPQDETTLTSVEVLAMEKPIERETIPM